MYLREYLESDAENILSWIDSERDFRLWSADRYGAYPIKIDDINQNYTQCGKQGCFYPLTLVDDTENIIGHLILRNPGNDKRIVRLGFIIVDNKIRGKGYGKILIELAIQYAKEKLGACEINLGVFKNNTSAYHCYVSAGFKEIGTEKDAYKYEDECWDCSEMILEE